MSERDFPDYFADADTNWNEAEYVLYGVPYDRTGSYRAGTADGPRMIRRAAWNNELYHIPTGLHAEVWKLHDFGNLDITNDNTPEEMVQAGYDLQKRILAEGRFPILLGGEHNVQMGPFKAVSETYPDVCVVQIDAHLDYRDEYDGTKFNHANALRRFVEYAGADSCAIIGVRSMEREEREAAREDGVLDRCFTSFMVKERGVKAILDQVLNEFGDRPLYLSIDIDGIDPAYAPGTGTPEPFGLTDWDALEIVKRCAPQLIGFDICEVAPPYDNGQTSMLASKLVREMLFWREHAKQEGKARPLGVAKQA